MIAPYAKLVTQLREDRGLTQTLVAETAGMSRSSYIALEKGEKEPSFTQATKLAGLFGVPVDQLMTGQLPDYSKYKQMIISFLREAKASGHEIKKTKLAKLLYLADFANYYKTKKFSMSGMAYRKIEYGPVPDSYFRVLEKLEEDAEIEIETRLFDEDKNMYIISETRVSERNDIDLLSDSERRLIKDIWSKWQDANTQKIVQFTHEQAPYKKTEFDQIISYDLILDEKEDYVY